jgi:putative transposase
MQTQRRGITLNYIAPGEPNQNAYIERFNRTFRTEVLDAYLFNSIEQVQAIADDWLTQYNEYRLGVKLQYVVSVVHPG